MLVPLMLLILSAPTALKKMLEDQTKKTDQEDERILRAWLEESRQKLRIKKEKKISPTYFNPNKITYDHWLSLGFDSKIASRIINYRKKGGRFRKKEDILKIYGIDKELVKSYYDYVILPSPKDSKTSHEKPSYSKSASKKTTAKKELVKLDLNLADTTQLQRIKGIGPVLSSRIVKYRQALGGFVHTDQLKEVYGIENEVYQNLLKNFEMQTSTVKKININQDSIKLLAKHPYLSFRISRAIVKYRSQHGNYQSIDELKSIHIVSDSIFQNIAPYIHASPVE